MSVATLTGDVDGSSRYNIMYVYVCQALRPITSRACANGTESAIFEIYFYRERKPWKKKISCSGVDSNLVGMMHCRPLPLPPSQWGSGSSGQQIWLLYC